MNRFNSSYLYIYIYIYFLFFLFFRNRRDRKKDWNIPNMCILQTKDPLPKPNPNLNIEEQEQQQNMGGLGQNPWKVSKICTQESHWNCGHNNRSKKKGQSPTKRSCWHIYLYLICKALSFKIEELQNKIKLEVNFWQKKIKKCRRASKLPEYRFY